MIKTLLKIIAILIVLSGGVWTLQGLNLLPGSFMRGDPQWIINGIVTMLAGLGFFWVINRKK